MAWANPVRGEASLEAEGRTYVLRPTLHALCGLEDRVGVGYAALLGRLPYLTVEKERDLVFAFLQARHSRTVRTVEDAGTVMDDAGGHQVVIRAVRAVLKRNRPKEPPPEKRGEGSPRPPQAQTGIGRQWCAMPVV